MQLVKTILLPESKDTPAYTLRCTFSNVQGDCDFAPHLSPKGNTSDYTPQIMETLQSSIKTAHSYLSKMSALTVEQLAYLYFAAAVPKQVCGWRLESLSIAVHGDSCEYTANQQDYYNGYLQLLVKSHGIDPFFL